MSDQICSRKRGGGGGQKAGILRKAGLLRHPILTTPSVALLGPVSTCFPERLQNSARTHARSAPDTDIDRRGWQEREKRHKQGGG